MSELGTCLSPPPEAVGGEPAGISVTIRRGGVERFPCRIEFWPFRDGDGTLIGLLGTVRDAGVRSVPDSTASQTRLDLQELRERLRGRVGFDSLIGAGPAHARLLQQVRLAAGTLQPVLIAGEGGTGKSLIARMIHDLSPARTGSILPLNCAALPAEVIEQELRKLVQEPEPEPGHDPPADPGPEGRTLLLEEVLALPRDLQLRLTDARSLDHGVRLIATTTGDPEAALREERLRPELYHALTVLVVRIEPLRDRRRDVPLLAQHLLEQVNQRKGLPCLGLEPPAISALEEYDWPGNVRELGRVVAAAHERAAARTVGANLPFTIRLDDLPAGIRGHLGAAYLPPAIERPVKPLDELLTEIERRLIETALSRARQNKSRAAELLGISRPRLYRRIKELNLPDETEPEPGPVPAPISTGH